MVSKGDRELLTSRILIADYEGNRKDEVFRRIGSAEERKQLQTTFEPVKDSKTSELVAHFQIVPGRTPDERQLKGDRQPS